MAEILRQTFDQIYLLNLPRRADKLIKTLWRLQQSGLIPQLPGLTTPTGQPFFQVWEAVDGYHPKIYNRSQKKSLPAGAYGYLLSWERVLNDAIRQRYRRILVLDDDVILHRNFTTLWTTWISQIQKMNANWKVLLLGASQHQEFPVHLKSSHQSWSNQSIGYYLPRLTDGSFSVGLDGSVFREMLQLIKPHESLLDSGVLREIYKQYLGSCYVAYPNLVIADVTESDIRPARDQTRLAEKLRWDLSQYVFLPKKQQCPLVSIMIPCYRAEKTLRRCLQSVLDQTYRPLEIILVDDGSPDQSYEIASQIFDRWQNHPACYDADTRTVHLKLLKHDQNRGCYRARNNALRVATGDILGYHDSDDVSVPYRIEEQVKAMLQFGVEVTCCQFLRTHLTEMSHDWFEIERQLDESRKLHQLDNGNYLYCCRPKVGLITAMFRKKTMDRLGEYLEWKWGADDEYLRRLFPEVENLQTYKVDHGTTDGVNREKRAKPMMNYLNDHAYCPGKYARIDQVMYLSYEMTEQNLTSQRKLAEKHTK